jgi:hypothetical protein
MPAYDPCRKSVPMKFSRSFSIQKRIEPAQDRVAHHNPVREGSTLRVAIISTAAITHVSYHYPSSLLVFRASRKASKGFCRKSRNLLALRPICTYQSLAQAGSTLRTSIYRAAAIPWSDCRVTGNHSGGGVAAPSVRLGVPFVLLGARSRGMYWNSTSSRVRAPPVSCTYLQRGKVAKSIGRGKKEKERGR